jgi:hypothetical protein
MDRHLVDLQINGITMLNMYKEMRKYLPGTFSMETLASLQETSHPRGQAFTTMII